MTPSDAASFVRPPPASTARAMGLDVHIDEEYATCPLLVNASYSLRGSSASAADTLCRVEKHDPEDKKALGKRLASCREVKGWKQEYAADQLGVTKAALSAWETGRNMPDALTLKLIAKVYGVSIDGILWDNSISVEALQFAAQFDNLNDKQQRSFRAIWLAYFEAATSDEDVEKGMPITQHRRATDALEIRDGEAAAHIHQRRSDRK